MIFSTLEYAKAYIEGKIYDKHLMGDAEAHFLAS
jgi:hypothetical protein